MLTRTGGFGCGCGCGGHERAAGMGGWFTKALNVAGTFVGDPALGSQIASQAQPAWTSIKQTPGEIADNVTPAVLAALNSGQALDPSGISPQAQQIAAGVAQDVARSLAEQGVILPAGTVGAELQKPSVLNAFGGQNAEWVLVGGLALGALLLLKRL